MERRTQSLEEILDSLGRVEGGWQDAKATRALAKLGEWTRLESVTRRDIRQLLDEDFEVAKLVLRTFLGLSQARFSARLAETFPDHDSVNVTLYRTDEERFVALLDERLDLADQINDALTRDWKWEDVFSDRLRIGRGSAISGGKRGRSLETFVEVQLAEVFGDNGFKRGGNFTSPNGSAKCDYAVPHLQDPLIVIEAKAFDTTGSKMSAVIGDLDAIIKAKRPDTALILVMDGEAWHQRKSDLRKIVERQNDGRVTRIYTRDMAVQLARDLETLREEHRLPEPKVPSESEKEA